MSKPVYWSRHDRLRHLILLLVSVPIFLGCGTRSSEKPIRSSEKPTSRSADKSTRSADKSTRSAAKSAGKPARSADKSTIAFSTDADLLRYQAKATSLLGLSGTTNTADPSWKAGAIAALASLQASMGDFATATQTALKMNPKDKVAREEAFFHIVEEQLKQGLFAESETTRHYIEDELQWKVNSLLGRYYIERGNLRQGEAAFQIAISSASGFESDYMFILGQMAEVGRYEEAEKEASRMAKSTDDQALLLTSIALVAAKRGDIDKAETLSRKLQNSQFERNVVDAEIVHAYCEKGELENAMLALGNVSDKGLRGKLALTVCGHYAKKKAVRGVDLVWSVYEADIVKVASIENGDSACVNSIIDVLAFKSNNEAAIKYVKVCQSQKLKSNALYGFAHLAESSNSPQTDTYWDECTKQAKNMVLTDDLHKSAIGDVVRRVAKAGRADIVDKLLHDKPPTIAAFYYLAAAHARLKAIKEGASEPVVAPSHNQVKAVDERPPAKGVTGSPPTVRRKLLKEAEINAKLEQVKSRFGKVGPVREAVDAVLESPRGTPWRSVVGSVKGAEDVANVMNEKLFIGFFAALEELRDAERLADGTLTDKGHSSAITAVDAMRAMCLGNNAAADSKDARRQIEELTSHSPYGALNQAIKNALGESTMSPSDVELHIRKVNYLAERSQFTADKIQSLFEDALLDTRQRGLPAGQAVNALASSLAFAAEHE